MKVCKIRIQVRTWKVIAFRGSNAQLEVRVAVFITKPYKSQRKREGERLRIDRQKQMNERIREREGERMRARERERGRENMINENWMKHEKLSFMIFLRSLKNCTLYIERTYLKSKDSYYISSSHFLYWIDRRALQKEVARIGGKVEWEESVTEEA